ncbi:MAG: hypothetical protein MI867_22080 [Pseudomonadales bacterium]|nr:hypothetical protein [Pseudomonadales bacterium]
MKKATLIIALLSFSVYAYSSDPRVSIKEVTDSRTTGKFFKGLSVDLEIKGKTLDNAIGIMPPILERAVSDLGENLLKEESSSNGSPIFKLKHIEKNYTPKLQLKLKNPARNASEVNIKGEIEVYSPQNTENEKVLIKDYLDHSGKRVELKELTDRGIKLTFFTKDDFIKFKKKAAETRAKARRERRDEKEIAMETMGEAFAEMFNEAFSFFGGGTSDLTFLITDTQNQIYKIELYNGNNEIIKTEGTSYSGNQDNATYGFDYRKMLPREGYLAIYLATEENVQRIPFDLSVVLP